MGTTLPIPARSVTIDFDDKRTALRGGHAGKALTREQAGLLFIGILRHLGGVTLDAATCWTTEYGLNRRTGYAQVRGRKPDGKAIYYSAHRVSYTYIMGEIPEGLTIDHICKVRNCVNPFHMEPVTQRENVLRSNNRAAINARKVTCDLGHEFTTLPNGGRVCLECKRLKRKLDRRRPLKVLPVGDPRHGTIGAYTNHACRCDLCKSAASARYTARKASIRQAS